MNGPRPIGDFLPQILRRTGVDKSRAAFDAALDELLPETQRPHVQVMGYRNGRLVLEVDSAPLFAELSGFRREELRERLCALVPDRLTAQLQFRLVGTDRA